MIIIIAAISQNDVIGKKGPEPLLWKLKEDLKIFKKITTGGVVVMGRNTMLSLRKPLPDRTNVVLSRTLPAGKNDEGFIIMNSVSEVLNTFPSFFVIGGAEIYREFINIADQVMLTSVGIVIESKNEFEVAKFPAIALEEQYYLAFESKVLEDIDLLSGEKMEYIFTKWNREILIKH